MATNVTQSLFGMTPQSIQAQRAAELDAQALRFAQLTPMQQAQMGLFRAGSQIGTGLAGLMGYEDPEIAQAKARQGLLSGVDMNDPESLLSVARQAQQAGDFQTAQALVTQANEVQAKQTSNLKTRTELETEQNRIKNATQFVKGRLPDLTDEQAAAIASDKEAVRKLLESPKTSTKTVEAGGRVLLINDQTGETIKDLGAKGKGELSALAGSIGQLAASMAGPRAETAAKAEGTEVGKATAQIQGKQDALISLQTSRSLLRGPDGKFNIYAGLFGPEETVVAKATKGLLGDRNKAINTENFLAEISTTVIPLLQEFGGNDSNEELRFLQRVVGGDQRLEPESIERIIKSAEAKIQRGIKRVQDQQKAVSSGQPLPTGATNSGNIVDFSTLKRN